MSIANSKAKHMFNEAVEYWKAGHYYYTPILNMPIWTMGFSGNVETWALMVDHIEHAGWELQHWAVAVDRKGRPQAMPLFVRRPTQAAPARYASRANFAACISSSSPTSM